MLPTALGLAAGTVLGGVLCWWWLRRRARAREALLERSVVAAARRADASAARVATLEARFAVLEAMVGEALVYIGRDGTVRGASPTAVEWFDLNITSPGGAPLTAMAALRSAELLELVEAGLNAQSETRLVRHGNRVLRAHAAPLPDGALLVLQDETDRERLARARRDLVANVSHDLRTPLTSIGLLVDALADGAVDQPALARSLVARIGEQVAALNSLLEGMLDLDRIESGQALFRLRPHRLTELVESALSALRPQVEQQAVTVTVAIPGATTVLADAPYVVRVITNLTDNAVRFSPPGGVVTLTASGGSGDEADLVVVSVADDGPGIPPADLERIFERFYRSDRARTGSGSGLGLAIARHIVEGHGGTIRAENRPERGTVFRFTLPAATEAGHAE
jgi:two-component system phosphate regulon sensor histidine kinase PhoR